METPKTPSAKRKRGKAIGRIVLGAAVLALCVGGVILYQSLTAKEPSTSTVTYAVNAVSEGEIASVISGSGTLSAIRSASVAAGTTLTVDEVFYRAGDAVAAGEPIIKLSSDAITAQLATLAEELATVQGKLATVTQRLKNRYVTSTKAGYVKGIAVQAGDVCEDAEYLCYISTDGQMQFTIDAADTVRQYDALTVQIGSETAEGLVTALSAGKATVVVDGNAYDMGATAEAFDAGGASVGTGTLTVNEHVLITAPYGRIDAVLVTEGQKVKNGSKLFRLSEGTPTETYMEYKKTEADLLAQIQALRDQLTIRADWDCVLTTISVKVGDELASGSAICTLSGTDGYMMSLSIDELDISAVQLGQDANITLDAIDGAYKGSVSNISYSGSGSFVTSYTATVETEPIAGAYPGMSASVEIITDTSGLSLIVPVNAVRYDNEQAYVYLAGTAHRRGETAAADALDLDSLEKAYVTTGMSDGSYIAVTGDALSVGTLIWVEQRTTTATYTADSNATTAFSFGGTGTQMGGTGGFPMGEPPSGFGGNYGSDTSERPTGTNRRQGS